MDASLPPVDSTSARLRFTLFLGFICPLACAATFTRHPEFFLLGCLALGVAIVSPRHHTSTSHILCRIGGLTWTQQQLCRGFFISGATGCGKTTSGIHRILAELFKNSPTFGGLVIDDKGTLHESLAALASSSSNPDKLILLQTRRENVPPPYRLNLVGDRSIPFATHARIILDTAAALGAGGDKDFFRNAAQIHIAQALEALHRLGQPVALDAVYHFLTDPDSIKPAIEKLEQIPGAQKLAWQLRQFDTQPPEQLGGVRGTVRNLLHAFTTPEIAEVFCADSTFTLDSLDSGRLLCLSMPQRFQLERRYVSTFLKQLFYIHALRRFDLSAEERAHRNLLVFVADEAQHFLTLSKDGLSDHTVVDVLREAGVAVIAATQSSTSLIPVLGAEPAQVFLLNLRSRFIFTAADEEDARRSAEHIGRMKIIETTETYHKDGRTRSQKPVEQYRWSPAQLRALPNHTAILVHPDQGVRKRRIRPLHLPASPPLHIRMLRFWKEHFHSRQR